MSARTMIETRGRYQYTPKLIAFLQRHWNKDVTGVRLAQLIGTSYKNLKQSVHRLRHQGYEFKSNKAPIGHICHYPRQDGSGFITRIKTAEGFKYVPLDVKKSPGRKPKEGVEKPTRQIKPKAETCRHKAKGAKVAGSGQRIAAKGIQLKGRNPTAKTRSRPHATNDHNPAVVKVRNTDERKAELIEAGWRTVKVGKAPATYKFLPPEKLAMYL